MNVEIRNALLSDTEDIHSLLFELAKFQHLEDSFCITVKRLSELLFDEKSLKALTALADGEIVGTALYYTSGVSTFSGKHIMFLEDLYVKEAFRKSGIGRELFNRLRAEAKENGCCKIQWKCQSWNINAGSFYKSVGSCQEDGWTTFSINHI